VILRLPSHWASLIVLLAIVMLIAAQPVGVLWHFAHDHVGDHADDGHDVAGVHAADTDADDHEADHGHLWSIAAAAVVPPRLSQPQPIAALQLVEAGSQPSRAPFPPFSPPRA
jgi:hypothetical protein